MSESAFKHPLPPSIKTRRVIVTFVDAFATQLIAANLSEGAEFADTTFQNATVYGYSAYDGDGMPVANAADARIGFDYNHMSVAVAAGGATSIQNDAGTRKRISSMFAAGTAGDSLVIEFEA